MDLCPECGGDGDYDIKPVVLEYDGRTVTVNMGGWYCNVCGQGFHNGEDMKVSDAALAELKANGQSQIR